MRAASVRQMHARKFRGFAEANDSRHIFRAGTAVAFGVPAAKARHNARTLAHVKRAHAFRPAKLVRGKRKQIDAKAFHVHGNFPGGLHRVAVEINARLARDAANFLDGLNGAELVVRVHHGDQHGFGAQRAANIFGIDNALIWDRARPEQR